MKAGFGIIPYDDSANWGSAGRLRGVGLVKDVSELPPAYLVTTTGTFENVTLQSVIDQSGDRYDV